MAHVEINQLIGTFTDRRSGKLRRVGWPIERVFLDGRQIATINLVPGAPVGLMAGVLLSAGEKKAVEDAIAARRGGVKPSSIGGAIKVDYELLDDEPDDELEDATELVDDE